MLFQVVCKTRELFRMCKIGVHIHQYQPERVLNKCLPCRTVTNTPILHKEDKPINSLVTSDNFANVQNKSKETYLDLVRIFESRDKYRRGHVEFIQTAMKHMQHFGVDKDLEAYKALINVLPKGKFIPQNIFQAEFMHYPKQQQVAIDVLEQMEDNGVIPDFEMEDILINIFGVRGYPVRKFWRMMYWMPKFKNLSPWPIPNPVPNDSLELAKLALLRMSSVDLQSVVTVYHTEDVVDSIDKTWVVSAQSPKQRELLSKRSLQKSVFVEGPFILWLRNASIHYFILKADPEPVHITEEEEDEDDVRNIRIPIYERPKSVIVAPSVHEQDDSIIYGMCATGISSKDSLLSWIRLLEKDNNPALGKIPVLFKLRKPEDQLSVIKSDNKEKMPTGR